MRRVSIAVALIGEHRGGAQRRHGVRRGSGAQRGLAVEPFGVDLRAAEALALDQIEQVALVRGAALDDELEVGQRGREPRARGVARVADPDHLRDQRIEIGRDVAAGRDAGVDPHARPEHGIEARDPSGRGQEVRLRVLRAHARLDRAAAARRRLRGQRLAAPDPDLELDQVRAGELLGEPVLDLEARIHLEERGARRR